MLDLGLSPSIQINDQLSLKGKVWQLKESNERDVLGLMQKYNYPELFARLLSQRCPEAIHPERFLAPKLRDLLPNPFLLKDMEAATSRIKQAIEKKEKITIFGDYDVDGATSTSLLVSYLTFLGAYVNFYIPDRIQEGYGPSVEGFDKLHSQGTQLVITVDCGTAAHPPLAHAQNLGLDVVVIDHHIPEKELPPAHAIVNPNRQDDSSGYEYLCAAGVTFLVMVALQSQLKETGLPLPDLKLFLDLVALGTVCDVVPLKGLNRAFVQQGLVVLNKQLNCGLKTLAHVAGIEGPCTAYHLGYILGPHINAGGRIGTASLGTQLLTSQSVDHSLPLAQQLNQLNKERKEIEAQVLAEALQKAQEFKDHAVLCIGMENWHPGIIGIVAGRLKESFHKPVFVVAFDKNGIGKGSGRSVVGINLGNLVQEAKHQDLLLNGGGHAMAAGLTVQKDKFKALQLFFNEKGKLGVTTPVLEIDGTIHLQGITTDLIRQLDQLGPFGASNPSPVFMVSSCQITRSQIRGGKHISCALRSEGGKYLEAMAFNAVGTPLEKALLNPEDKFYHLAGSLKIDIWQGREKIKFYIDDIRFI
ncbi:MAG: single-stranded-DNA-specific exonuclease RecJ [Alphaproteobacteria bacterium]